MQQRQHTLLQNPACLAAAAAAAAARHRHLTIHTGLSTRDVHVQRSAYSSSACFRSSPSRKAFVCPSCRVGCGVAATAVV